MNDFISQPIMVIKSNKNQACNIILGERCREQGFHGYGFLQCFFFTADDIHIDCTAVVDELINH